MKMKKYKKTKTFRYKGKRHYIYGDTDEEVYEKMANRKRDLEEGKTISSRMAIKDWCSEYISVYKVGKVNQKWVNQITRYCNNLCEFLGNNMPICNIRGIHLQKYLNTLDNYADSTIEKHLVIIKQVFRTAYNNDLIANDITKNLSIPKGKDQTTRRSITDKERKYLLQILGSIDINYTIECNTDLLECKIESTLNPSVINVTVIAKETENLTRQIKVYLLANGKRVDQGFLAKKNNWKMSWTVPRKIQNHRGELYIKFQLYCGLRPGEVIPLRWKDIDFKNRNVNITKAYKVDKTIGEPKTKAGIRKVPIPDVFFKVLKEKKGEPFDLITTNINGKMFTHHNSLQLWHSIRRDMNLAMGCKIWHNELIPPLPLAEDFVMYNLRHTYCTDLQRAGVSIDVARRLMGHSNIAVTSKIYTHYSTDVMEQAREKLNNLHG